MKASSFDLAIISKLRPSYSNRKLIALVLHQALLLGVLPYPGVRHARGLEHTVRLNHLEGLGLLVVVGEECTIRNDLEVPMGTAKYVPYLIW